MYRKLQVQLRYLIANNLNFNASKDYYRTLNLPSNASQADIKKSFRELAKKYHPDSSAGGGLEDKFK